MHEGLPQSPINNLVILTTTLGRCVELLSRSLNQRLRLFQLATQVAHSSRRKNLNLNLGTTRERKVCLMQQQYRVEIDKQRLQRYLKTLMSAFKSFFTTSLVSANSMNHSFSPLEIYLRKTLINLFKSYLNSYPTSLALNLHLSLKHKR